MKFKPHEQHVFDPVLFSLGQSKEKSRREKRSLLKWIRSRLFRRDRPEVLYKN